MNTICLLLLSLSGVIVGNPIIDQEQTTLSPFFVLQGEAKVEDFPLKATRADVVLQGNIAQVKITQLYQNRGTEVIEALYVFPASTKAIVYGMQMFVEDRLIIASLLEKEQARQKYEEAKQAGKTASLLEMNRPNVYTMSVANILPGELIRVEIFYTELVLPNGGIYHFQYPAVVMPRYGENKGMTATPYLRPGKAESYLFQVNVTISSVFPISEFSSPTHKFKWREISQNEIQGAISPFDSAPGTRDVEVIYSLASEKIEVGLATYDADVDDHFGTPFRIAVDNLNSTITWDIGTENFFLAMVQPPKPQYAPEDSPREFIFILDVSGSMTGFPWDTSLKIFSGLLKKLRSDVDYFNLVVFESSTLVWRNDSVLASRLMASEAESWARNHFGGGGTEMLEGIRAAFALPSQKKGYARTLCILTDGGVSAEREIFDEVATNLGKSNFFVFVIGSSPNRYLTGGIARIGRGEEYWVQDGEDASVYIEQFYQFSGHPLLTDIKVTFDENFHVYNVSNPAGILLAERPIVVCGKYRGSVPPNPIAISGFAADGSLWQSSNILANPIPCSLTRMLKYLWVGLEIDDIRYLTGQGHSFYSYGNDVFYDKDLMLKLALKYSVLTEVTSFLAIDNHVRYDVDRKKLFTITQPLPLPAGVTFGQGNTATDPDASNSPAPYDSSPSAPPPYHRPPSLWSSSTVSKPFSNGVLGWIVLGAVLVASGFLW